MQALEVGHLRRISRLDQCLESSLDQLDAPAAQHSLLAEEVGFGLFLERCLDHAGARAAYRGGVRQRKIARLAACILMDRDQHRRPSALHVRRTHRVSRRLGRDHHHVDVVARLNLAVVDIEAVREGERRALANVRLDLVAVDRGDMLVGHQHHHEVGALDSFGDFSDLEAGFFRLVPRSPSLAQADGDLDPRVVEVLRMRVTLRAITDDGHLLALDE